ncbi:MAG: LPS-assembly protein LptD [Lewinellaceae bacterium]|nr:LPS-assembly protein LptD [Lewinellaceae bacterium]
MNLSAQVTDISVQDTLPPARPDSLQVDSLGAGPTAARAAQGRQVTFSKDSLDAPVEYNATDSMIYDIKGQKIHLYGNASVSYTSINLKAAHIIFDWATNVVTAEGMPDSLGRPSGKPEFSDGAQSFVADSMRYNFQTRKGVVYDVTTKQNDVVVHGARSKFVSSPAQDSTQKANDVIFSSDALFTTCTHDNPHFGIHSRKQKVVPNKLVVVGPSNLEIMGVPTPLWLPFGFFPISSGRRTGLLFPRDYQYSPQWGFGLEGIGWFFPLGDHFNLSLTTNLYIKGTWGVNASSQYRKRYKYNGSFDLGYDVRRQEDNEGNIDRPKSFRFRWSHQQDRSAHPTNTFGGSINIQTNNYQSRVFNDASRVLQNQLNSNLSFSKNWRDKPINLNASLSHNQNSATRNVTINFPNVKFQTQALYPFKRQERSGKEKWFETITLRYQGDARNRFEATDTTLFTQKTFEDAQFGVQHSVNSGTSFKLFRYLNLNPSVNYDEVWYLKSLRKGFTPGLEIDTIFNNGVETYDTTAYGEIQENLVTGFESFREFSASISLNTQLFGTMQFKKGWLRGIRHVMKPSVSFGYTPDYTIPELGYFRTVRDSSTADGLREYSIFDGAIFGGPPTGGRQMAMSYSINNIFEAKYFSKKDSTDKKLKLFDNIVVSGNYNFAADSLNFSPVNISGTTRLAKGMTTVGLRAQFDPYAVEEVNGRAKRINEFAWNRDGKLLRFVNAQARFTTNITVGKIRALFMGQEEEVVEDPLVEEAKRLEEPEETDFLSLFENFRIGHNLVFDWEGLPDGRDTFRISTHSINCQGSIALTDNWNINIGNFGYDFVRKGITYPSVGFSRDLHCWEMGMNWQPTRGTYSFFIQVRPGTLDFLKIPYNRNNIDARSGF